MTQHPAIENLMARLADSEAEYLDAIQHHDYSRAIMAIGESRRILIVLSQLNKAASK